MIYTLTLNPAIDRELTVREIEFDQVLRARAVRLDWGGKGLNVSRMLASLGAASLAIGYVGGAAGQQLQDGLSALGIDTDFVRTRGETRSNVSIVTESRDKQIKVNEAGPEITRAEQHALRERVRARACAGDFWVMAGSLPPGVGDGFYAELITDVQSVGGKAILDTSGAALRAGWVAGPFLAKPNAAELEELTGSRVRTPAEALRSARSFPGPSNLVVSMGELGAVLVTATGTSTLRAPPIREQNAIGAGDSLVAGLVYSLARGDSWTEALRWGVACGAATAALPGTTVGSRAEVLALLQQTPSAQTRSRA